MQLGEHWDGHGRNPPLPPCGGGDLVACGTGAENRATGGFRSAASGVVTGPEFDFVACVGFLLPPVLHGLAYEVSQFPPTGNTTKCSSRQLRGVARAWHATFESDLAVNLSRGFGRTRACGRASACTRAHASLHLVIVTVIASPVAAPRESRRHERPPGWTFAGEAECDTRGDEIPTTSGDRVFISRAQNDVGGVKLTPYRLPGLTMPSRMPCRGLAASSMGRTKTPGS
ncbi:unnamed protein product [Lampetra fluviatilis]